MHESSYTDWIEYPHARLRFDLEKERGHASSYYLQRSDRDVQTLKVTTITDTESLAVLDLQCSVEWKYDTKIGPQVVRRNADDLLSIAADKGFHDWMSKFEFYTLDVDPLVLERATFYERDRANRHYCHRTNYRVQTLKITKLVDTESQAILDVHCSTTLEGSDADLYEQIARRNAGDLRTLAADKGYDKNALRERLREIEIRPLIKHCIRAPYDHAHNAQIDEDLYAQRSMAETVNSAVKRSLGYAVQARDWYREFREIALMCVVYNIKRSVKQ